MEWYTPSTEDNEAIRKIFLGEDYLLPVEENTVHIPIATNTSIGLIKGSNEINQIGLSPNGTGIINSIGVDKIIDVEGYTLILNGGAANI